jgi:HSP20 family protein
MFATLHRPALSSPFARNGRVPIGLVDAMLADWLSPSSEAIGSASPTHHQPSTEQPVLRARVEVVETETGYELRAELPGVRKQDIEIDVDGAQVSLRARLQPPAQKKDGEKLLYSERSHAAYQRSVELPQAVDASRASAQFEDGVLTLTLPRLEALRSTRVSIS